MNHEGKNTVHRFRTLFNDLPLKYQNVTYCYRLQYQHFYRLLIFRLPHLDPLSKKSQVKKHKWTFEENKALTEFISIAKTDSKYGEILSIIKQNRITTIYIILVIYVTVTIVGTIIK